MSSTRSRCSTWLRSCPAVSVRSSCRSPVSSPQALQRGRDLVDQRWQRRLRVQPADPVAAERRDHLDHGRVRTDRQPAPAGPRQRLVQRLVHQRRDQTVEQVGTGRRLVAAHSGQPVRRGLRGDQVSGGDRLPAFAQPPGHHLHQVCRGPVGADLPQPLVVLGRGHAGLVPGEGVQALEGVRHQVAARAGCAFCSRYPRPVFLLVGRGDQPQQCGAVESATHHHDRPAAGARPRRPYPGGHVALPGVVAPAGRRVAAQQVEVDRQPLGEPVVRIDLDQVVPERVDVVHAEVAADPADRVGVPAVRVGVPVGPLGERRVPRGQVDEAHVSPDPPALGQRDPLGGVPAERAPRGVRPLLVAVVGVDGDRQLVPEQQFVEALVHVDRPLHQHVPRPQRGDGALHQPGARRAVVAYPDDRDVTRVHCHRHQPGSWWRAS